MTWNRGDIIRCFGYWDPFYSWLGVIERVDVVDCVITWLGRSPYSVQQNLILKEDLKLYWREQGK